MALAEEIRMGDLSKRLNMDRDDEIGELAHALDAVADGLAEKADDLLRDISAASMEQAKAISQTTRGLDHIDQATQHLFCCHP